MLREEAALCVIPPILTLLSKKMIYTNVCVKTDIYDNRSTYPRPRIDYRH